MEALDDGYDEALLLDASGFVSEGAGENLFIVKDGVVYTPDLSAGALNGITRNTVFAICTDLGLKLVEKRITRDEVYICRRGVLHRHRGRGDADPRARPHRDRQRRARADHREDPERVLRHRQRPQPEVRRMADQGMNTRREAPTRPRRSSKSLPRTCRATASVFCPNPKMPLWSNHPKVFIDVATTGQGRCPYCGTVYQLKAGETVGSH